MDSQSLNVLKVENQNDQFDWLYSEVEHLPSPFGTWQQDSRLSNGSLFNFELDPYQFPNDVQNTHLPFFGLEDFEEMIQELGTFDIKLPPFQEDITMNPINTMPLNMTSCHVEQFQDVTNIRAGHDKHYYQISETKLISSGSNKDFPKRNYNNSGRQKKTDTLELDEIQRFFHVPITKAAKELRVGLTVLKKRCRELNIMRWPHRKIKSLQSLIDNVKEMGLASSEVKMLEEHQRMLEKVPEMELTERTKKLRQACFKANYKKRRAMAATLF